MPARNDYSQALGQARCAELVDKKRHSPTACEVLPQLGCWRFCGSVNTDGYGQVWTKKNENQNSRGRAAQTAFLLHVVSYVAATGQHPHDLHISHLCDERRCFNPDHLVAETPTDNNSRKGCPGSIFCSVHGHLVVDLCKHSPRCIRASRDDVNCCLAICESDLEGWAGPIITGETEELSKLISMLSITSTGYSGEE